MIFGSSRCSPPFSFRPSRIFHRDCLAILLAKNSKNKRAFWCMEELDGKHVLSAMANFPETALTAAEFDRICHALVIEVDNIEQALMDD